MKRIEKFLKSFIPPIISAPIRARRKRRQERRYDAMPIRHLRRQAVDEFFADKAEVPLVLPTGQAILFKLPAGSSA